MSQSKKAESIIYELEHRGFYATCPCCQEDIQLRGANLFYLDRFTPAAAVLLEEKRKELRERAKGLREKEEKTPKRSEVTSQAVNIGNVLEQIAPSMKAFPFVCNDCRSLFKPIDYIVFNGLCKNKEVSDILFVDIKTGRARLTSTERDIRQIVEKKRVLWDTYRAEVVP